MVQEDTQGKRPLIFITFNVQVAKDRRKKDLEKKSLINKLVKR